MRRDHLARSVGAPLARSRRAASLLRAAFPLAPFAALAVAIAVSGGALAQEILLECAPAPGGGGDVLDRGFYVSDFPGTSLYRVDLWMSAASAGSYTLSVTARAGAYDGPVLGTALSIMPFEGGTAPPVRTGFVFYPAPSVPPGSVVAFVVAKLAGPAGNVYYQPTTSGECPAVTQTHGTSPPLDSVRRQGVPITIYGNPRPDLRADRLEVTQAIQDLRGTVRLVAGKRTFVRFHISSSFGEHPTYALLRAERSIPVGGAWIPIVLHLAPWNGAIAAKASPNRSKVDDAFLFELPGFYTEGTVKLTGLLNPDTEDRDRDPSEPTYENNEISTTVRFERVPALDLVLYSITYTTGGDTVYCPPGWQVDQLVDWLRRGYPVSAVNAIYRAAYIGDHRPSCTEVNGLLAVKRLSDVIERLFGSGTVPAGSHYYGMVDDTAGFMRGCAAGIPSSVASGPTGTMTWGWDDDGTYGDWYGAHELAHTYGRYHANYCGASGGAAYPYPSGQISSATTGDSAFYGFDVGTRAVYAPPTWKDLMTYCDYQWVSDFTYHGLMDHFQGAAGAGGDVYVEGEALAVVGGLDAEGTALALRPTRYFARAPIPVVRQGIYEIVLFDSSGNALARYPFTPKELAYGPPLDPGTPDPGGFIVDEVVPFVPGTARVEIVGPRGLLGLVRAGLGVPEVRLLEPNGGEILDGDPIRVRWTAYDPDGDRLHYSVSYTPNGIDWEEVAADLAETFVDLDAANVRAGSHALFRVVASDGVHAASDDSDAPNVVPNRLPVVRIVEPAGDLVVAYGQTVAFEGSAYDADDGTLDGDSLVWTSSLTGELGKGARFAVGDLGVGKHTITLSATDSMGGTSAATVRVNVLLQVWQIPLQIDALAVTPSEIEFYPAKGQTSALVRIENQVRSRSISWSANAADAWVSIAPDVGSTPGRAIVTVPSSGFEPGVHRSSVIVSSPGTGDAYVRVTVYATPRIVLPGSFVRGDANDDGKTDISDAVFGLGCLFQGTRCPECPDAADVQDDGGFDISDPIAVLNYLFLDGPRPSAPFPDCGLDPTLDAFGPCSYTHCR